MPKEIYRGLTYEQVKKALDRAIGRRDVRAAWCSAGWQAEDGLIRYTVTVERKEEDENPRN